MEKDILEKPYAVRFRHALRDAKVAARICHLPLEPQRAPKNLQEWVQDHFFEPTSLACTVDEMAAKSRIYRVRDFNYEEVTEIFDIAQREAAIAARQGKNRPRRYHRD